MSWPYFRVDVEGESMLPTYLPGDRVLVRRHGRPLRAGDVVVHRDSTNSPWTVTRIVDVREPDQPMVAGDNPGQGSGSRDDIRVNRADVGGRVVAKVSSVDRPRRRIYR